MSDPHRPDPPERDPVLDAAWKAHSTELPPRRVDAAIAAAARRETRSRPRAIGDDDASARGPSRAWWGLAAAATIGAIAFGVLQLYPQPATEDRTIVASDMPRMAPERAAQPLEEPKSESAPPQDKAPAAVTAPRESDAPVRAAPKAPAQKPVERKERVQSLPVPPAPEAPPPIAPRAFPGAADARVDEAEGSRARAVGKLAAPARTEAQNAAVMAQAQRDGDRTLRTPVAWIEHIRKLYDERRFDEAARELNAFRAAYADADARLPGELRTWAQGVRRE